MNRRVALTIVVPSFKQANTISHDLLELSDLLASMGKEYEIILVVDGDVDNTVATVESNSLLSHVRVFQLQDNKGKGAALRYGLSQAQGDIAGFLDAGGDIDLSCLPVMIDLMEFSQADIVIGSKRHLLSQVSYPLLRRLYSVGYQTLNRFLFHMNIRDTQVGLKIFRKQPLQEILPYLTIKKFAFDLELLVIASMLGYRNIVEAPIRINHRFQSTINLHVVFETLFDTLGLFARMKRKKIIKPSQGVSISFAPTQEHHKNRAHQNVR